MEFFKLKTSIDFMGLRRPAFAFSILLMVASLFFLWQNGLRLGLDFTGGIQVEAAAQTTVSLERVRQTLEQAHFEAPVVQTYGSPKSFLMTLGFHAPWTAKVLATDAGQAKLKKNLKQLLPNATIERIDFVGPQLGKELAMGGVLALLVALIGTMIYILLRFEYRFAISAALALVHDPVLILGIFSVLNIEFDVNALGALLAVVGYSLNDTIVVFDRVRENFKKLKVGESETILNLSINQTLSRTIMTSGLTLIAVVVLFCFGGAMIHSFALAMIIGIVIGTYSSIYVAGALALVLGVTRRDLMGGPKLAVDNTQIMNDSWD